MRFFVILLLVMFVSPAYSAADKTDHPLLSAYEGSNLRRKDVKDFNVYDVFTGADDQGKPAGFSVEGKITRILYKDPKDRSVLEIYRNYESALVNAGAEILYQCNQAKGECIKRYARRALSKFNKLSTISNTDGRYLLGKIKKADYTAFVVVAVGKGFTQIDVAEIKEMETDKVVVNAAVLGNGLDQNGYVIVEGIYFDTNKTALKPASKPALVEVAKLLAARAGLKVYVVGHTDMKGSLAHNMGLSKGRAKAVVTALVKQYGVAANRLEGHGVGPLAPQASNAGDNGRAKNRRVVLVAR